MPALSSAFTAFVNSTGPTYVSGAEDLINESHRRTHMLSWLLRGKSKELILRGGANIKDMIILENVSTARNYLPNESQTWSLPQVGTTLTSNWRFTLDFMGWTDHEVELNTDGMSAERIKHEFKRILYVHEQRMWTSLMEFMEDSLWACPTGASQYTAMEDAGGRVPYSIPVFINEQTNGLWSGWTNVQGVSRSTYSAWRPQLSRYDYNDPADGDGNRNGLLNKFDEMYRKVCWNRPPMKQVDTEVSTSDEERLICCSTGGIGLYQDLCRNSQTVWKKVNDRGVENLVFQGIPLEYIAALDDAQLYDASGSTFAAETATTTTTPGYRYYWIDRNYLLPIFQNKRYFFEKPPFQPSDLPFTNIKVVDVWRQLWCRSSQRLGMVSPGG